MATSSAVASPEALTTWAPQPGPQSLLLSCSIPDVLFGGARGGGKSDGLLGDWATHSARYPDNAHGLIIRRTYDELDELVRRSSEIYGPLGAKWKPSKYQWVMPWGGVLKMRYLQRNDDAQRYQGHSYNWLAIDEAGNFPSFEPIRQLKATLRDKNGIPVKFRATANPGGVGHAEIKREYIDPSPPLTPFQDPNTGVMKVFIPSRLQDNVALMENDPTYIKRLRGSGPAWLVRAWLEGDWNAAPDGGVLKAEWLRRYSDIPVEPARYMTVQSWDTAYKSGDHNDPSVCTTWAITTTGYYLIDVHVAKLDYPSLKKRIIKAAERESPNVILIEDKASGQSLIQELRASTQLPIKAIEPHGDKITRALAVSDMIEAGLVSVPNHAPWLLDYELELTTFPTKGAHDDQVDSTTQFLAWARNHASRRFEMVGSGVTRISYRDANKSGFGIVQGGIDIRGFQ